MIKKIILDSIRFLVSSLVAFLTLYVTNPAIASEMNNDADMDNALGIVIEEVNNPNESSKISSVPDLGDDQAFPFIPGFGKNSGKD